MERIKNNFSLVVFFACLNLGVAQGHSFTTFDTGTITGGAAAVTQLLDGSGLSGDYLFFVVSADFIAGGNPAWSQTITMELDNNGSTIFKSYSGATTGALANANPTTLTWSGSLQRVYVGGGQLRIKFLDGFNDGGGPYTSELQNVTVTIYLAPLPSKTFTTFNTGTITGGGASVDEVLDVTGLTYDYLFYVISADFVSGANPVWSETIQMELDNNGSSKYKTFSGAISGAQQNENPTTLYWMGIMERMYSGGTALRVKFRDTYSDGGPPYTSDLNNVSVTIYPATIPNQEFSTFNTGTITGGGADVTQLVDVTGLTDDYLFYTVRADFVAGANPAWSETIQMGIDNNSTTEYRSFSNATTGVLSSPNPTTLIWTGILNQKYIGGTALRIKFRDAFDDASGPYTSELQNVSFTIFTEPSSTPLPVELVSFEGYNTEEGVLLKWETATETNNYGFQVQRTKDKGESENQWEDVGFVNGNGTTNSPKYYEFTDSELPNSDEVSYRLKQIDNDGTFAYSKIVTVDLTTITSVDDEIVYEFALEQNYPNPFNPETSIEYTIGTGQVASIENVTLKVYDVLGKEVITLVNEQKTPGIYSVKFDASNLSSGMYFYRISVGNEFNSVRKMILVK